MIIKIPPKQPGTQSSFGRLANYIKDAPKEGEKVLASWSSNIVSEEHGNQVLEVELVQQLNTKTASDKTYHLIVSFPDGERPSEAVLQDIELEIASALGLAEHQRLTAVHDDTSHLHMHIAINKVHPETAKLVTPFRDYKTLVSLARQLERKHGLSVLQPEKNRDESQSELTDRATDVEQHTKTVSFNQWAIDTLRQPIADLLTKKSATWTELHGLLVEQGLLIKPRGRGFIITTENGKLFVKPSAIGREFSRAGLEDALGVYVESQVTPEKCPYQKRPLVKTGGTAKLFQAYVSSKAMLLTERKRAFVDYQQYKASRLSTIRRDATERRRQLRRDRLINKYRKGIVSRNITKLRERALNEAYAEFTEKRASIMQQTSVPSWTDYLIAQAEQGDTVALDALKTHTAKQGRAGNYIASDTVVRVGGLHDLGEVLAASPKVNKNGSLSYPLNGSDRLIVNENSIHVYGKREDTFKTALLVAQRQYGRRLKLTGDETFVANCHQVIRQHRLDVTVQQAQEMQR